MWLGIALCLFTSLAYCSAVCTPNYEVFADSHVSGSTAVAAADRAACEVLCDGNSACVGYDWTDSNTCWPTLNPDQAITTDITATHYRRRHTCVDGAATCQYWYVGAFTGPPLGSTLMDICGDSCTTNSACNGYVTDASGSVVCLLVASTASADRTVSTDKRMYTKKNCDLPSTACAASTYQEFADMHVSGGSRASSGDVSVAACQGVCTADIACVGVDYTDSGQCYKITNPDTAITPDPVATHYNAQVECTTGSNVCGYDQYGAFVPNAGQTETASQTFDECIALCNNDGGCTQLAYDASTSTCVTSTGTAAQKTGNSVYQMLRKQSTCPDTVATTVVGPTCGDPEWEIRLGRSSNFATSRSAFTTLAACQAECVRDTTCVAVDYQSAAPQCWVHTSVSNLADERSTAAINQYVLLDRCPGVCEPTYQDFQGMGSVNGVQQTGVNTLTACQANCIASTTCIAVDYTTSNVCYFHVFPAAARRVDPTSTQYVLNRDCSSDSTTAAATTVAGTTAPGGTTIGACVPDWTNFENTGTSGGVPQNGVTTLAACQQACVDQATCEGLDFGGGCWLHFNANFVDTQGVATGVMQYRLNDRCPQACTNTWSPTSDTHGSGGTMQNGIDSLEECQAGCIADDNCVALDYTTNVGNFPCWYFFATGYAESPEAGTNHYKLTRCVPDASTTPTGSTGPDDCINTWQNTTSRSSGGGVAVPGSNGLTSCLLACVADDECVAADVGPADVCYHHKDAGNLADERGTSGITQYVLTRCAPTTACPIFAEFEDKHAFSGMPQTSATTVASCKAVCIANANCKGIDFDRANPGTKCYTFSTEFSADTLADMAGTTHYELVCRAGQSPPPTGATPSGGSTAPVCDDVFTKTEGMSSDGGTRRAQFPDLDACQDGCVDDEDCLAIDSNVNPFSCWFHRNAANLDTKKNTPGVDQYVLARCVVTECPKFEEYENVHAPGGIPQPSITSLADCKAACDTSTDCKGLDYAEDATGTKCWLLNSQSAPDGLEALDNVNHYDLICRTGETPSTGTGGTTRPGGSTTGGGCVDSFTSEADVHGFGGSQQTDIQDLDACKEACSEAEENDCVALDFVSGSNQCWLLPNGFTPDSIPAPGITQYTINRCVPGCDDTFDVVENHHGRGGTLGAETGEEDCKAACSDNLDCLAFDLGGEQCWFFTEAYTREDVANVNHYIIKRCTVGPTTRGTTVRPTTATSEPCLEGFDTVQNRAASTDEQPYTGIASLNICRQICGRYPLPCYAVNYARDAQTCTLVLDPDFTTSFSGTTTLLQAIFC